MAKIYASNIQAVLHPFEDAQLTTALQNTSDRVEQAFLSVNEKLNPAREVLNALPEYIAENGNMLDIIERQACRIETVSIRDNTGEIGAATLNLGANAHTIGVYLSTHQNSFPLSKGFFILFTKSEVQKEELFRLARIYPGAFTNTSQPYTYRNFYVTYGGTNYSAWQIRWETGVSATNLAGTTTASRANASVPMRIYRLDAYPITED